MSQSLRSQTIQARRLRRESTQAERLLWHWLRNRRCEGAKFRRQQPIGPWIVDFFCKDARLVIEVDSGYHSDLIAKVCDETRETGLRSLGLVILHVANNEILGMPEQALQRIRQALWVSRAKP